MILNGHYDSKDQIRSISRIHENYARMLTTFLSSQLRTYVHISVTSVDQIPFEDFIRSISSLTVLNIYSMAPLKGNLVMDINPNIAYALLDRSIGGKGTTINKTDNLTETIMEGSIERLAKEIFSEEIYVKVFFRLIVGDIIDSNIIQLIPLSFAKELVEKLLNDNSFSDNNS